MAVSRKIRCRVEKIIPMQGDVYTIDIVPADTLPRFKPGQFLHLALDEYDPSGFWPESRIFSIASSPLQRDRLRLSYSVKGVYTARMARELAEGGYVWIKLPYGDFVIEDKSDVVLFAGGTGITAYTAFLNGMKPDFPHSIYLAYGARRRELLLYREDIERINADIPQLTVRFFIENDDVEPSDPHANEILGIISVKAMMPLIRNPLTSVYYISGPPAMLSAIAGDLESSGVDKGAIRIDAWE